MAKSGKQTWGISAAEDAPEADLSELVSEEEFRLPLDLSVTVSRETLEGTPVRVLVFLKGIGTSAAIRAAMATRGYNGQHHIEGWRLLHAVSGFHEIAAPVEDASVREAINQLDDWDEDGFQIIAATLRYRFPEQANFLLDGLQVSTGAAAVSGVKQLMDRLDALESGSGRDSSKQKDQAALRILAERGIDSKERQRLRALITVAESAPDLSLPDAASIHKSESTYLQSLMALRAWFEEWSGIARVAIRRQDYLIRLGLAKRRSPTAESASLASTASQAR
jgi:hypothetical protein